MDSLKTVTHFYEKVSLMKWRLNWSINKDVGEEKQRHRDTETEIQRQRDTEIQRKRDIETQKQRVTEIQRNTKKTETQKHVI